MSQEEVIGRQVAAARALTGMTQADLAFAVGIPRPAVSLIESGLRKLSVTELLGIARATGRPLDWFVTEAEVVAVMIEFGSDERRRLHEGEIVATLGRIVKTGQNVAVTLVPK